jgi:hypothetical protein
MTNGDQDAPAAAYRVAVIGSLASVDLGLAQALRAVGVRADVLRDRGDAAKTDYDDNVFPDLPPAAIVRLRDSVDLVRRLRGYDFVFTYSAQLGFSLGRFLSVYPVLSRMGWPPFVNIGTGSDIMERAIEQSDAGKVQRRTMRTAVTNVIPAYPAAVRSAARIRLTNATFLPFPHRPPPPAARRLAAERKTPDANSPLGILHASNLDWGASDSAGDRQSTKGNDRFIRALARFRSETDRELRVTMLDRGPDRAAARELVAELGIDDIVDWRGELRHGELYETLAAADLVVDQFDVGALGGIAWEALTMGRPVLTYVAPSTGALIYDEPPPVLNARTEDQIVERLHEATTPGRLAQVAEHSERWIAPLTDSGQLARYLIYALLASGRDLDLLEHLNPEH